MNIFTSILRWLCAAIVSIALSAWIIIATINITIANRDVVKSWLANSGIYDSALQNLLRVDAGSTSSTGDANITTADMQKALTQTFNSAYLQSSTNTVIDATYDWMDGKTTVVTFSIPVQDKASEFSNNLAVIVESKLAALPQCTGRSVYPNCLPAGVTPADYAKRATRLSSNTESALSNEFLSSPLTQDSFMGGVVSYPWLPYALQSVHFLLFALPVAILIFAGIYISVSKDKILGLLHVGRQIVISSAIFLVFGLIIWIGSNYIDLSFGAAGLDEQQAALTVSFVNPLVNIVLSGLGGAMCLIGGGVAAFGASVWIGAFIWRKKNSEKQLARDDVLYDKPTKTDAPSQQS